MRRELFSIRHALIVVVGAVIIALANEAAFSVLGLLPGYSEQVSEWLTVHPQLSTSRALLSFLLLAVVLSLIQEALRTRGLSVSIFIGVIFGVVTYASRFSSTPTHLYDVAASFAACRAAGAIAASVLMYVSKRRWVAPDKLVTSSVG